MRRMTNTRRGGFTLIELLVAAALALVVMTVLSMAFQTGMQTLSQLKSVVGMAEQLRAAEGVMRRDLRADHLEAVQNRTVRVSEAGSHLKGYFAFIQGGMAQTGPSTAQGYGPFAEPGGTGADAPLSFRTANATSIPQFGRAWMDTLSFTTRLDGTKPQEVFTAPAIGNPSSVVPPSRLLSRLRAIDPNAQSPESQSADPTDSQLTSRWAEISYVLVPAGGGTARVFTSDEGTGVALPLYTLHRRQRVLAERTVTSPTTGPNLFGATDAAQTRGLAMARSALPGNPWQVLGPEALATVTANRLGGANDALAPSVATAPMTMQGDLQMRGYPIPPGSPEFGSDVVLNNVVSMTVRPVYSHNVPQTVIDFIDKNGLSRSSTPILSPDGLTTTVNDGRFLSYTPRDLLFPNVVPGNGANGYSNPNSFPRFFDTTGGGFNGTFIVNGSNSVVAPITGFTLKAIELKLRLYDSKNMTTRQVTVLVDL